MGGRPGRLRWPTSDVGATRRWRAVKEFGVLPHAVAAALAGGEDGGAGLGAYSRHPRARSLSTSSC